MKNAFASRQIKPDLDCVTGDNAWDCMSKIKNRLADLITLDPADAYRAHRYFQVIFSFLIYSLIINLIELNLLKR